MCLPVIPNNSTASQAETLWAPNFPIIHAHGPRCLTLALDLCRTFRRVLIVADVPYPVIGIDFLPAFKPASRFFIDGTSSPSNVADRNRLVSRRQPNLPSVRRTASPETMQRANL